MGAGAQSTIPGLQGLVVVSQVCLEGPVQVPISISLILGLFCSKYFLVGANPYRRVEPKPVLFQLPRVPKSE